MKKMIKDHGFSQDTMTIYYDNSSAISISKNLMQHSRTKHTNIRHYFIKDLVELNIVLLEHVNPKYQLADFFTKLVDGLRFDFFLGKPLVYMTCPNF
jgi:hypothetical protein